MGHVVHKANGVLKMNLAVSRNFELFDQRFDFVGECPPRLVVLDDLRRDLPGETIYASLPESFDDRSEVNRRDMRRRAARMPETPVEVTEPKFVVSRVKRTCDPIEPAGFDFVV